MHWRRDPVDLAEIVRPAEDAVRPLLNGRDLELDLRRAGPGRCRSSATAPSSSGSLINLLSNAVKFTEDGGRIDVPARASTDDEAVLRVSDTGIGIPVEEQDELFQRFFRSSTAQSARSRAPASACRSSPRSSRPTAAGSTSRPPTSRAPRSPSGCRWRESERLTAAG